MLSLFKLSLLSFEPGGARFLNDVQIQAALLRIQRVYNQRKKILKEIL